MASASLEVDQSHWYLKYIKEFDTLEDQTSVGYTSYIIVRKIIVYGEKKHLKCYRTNHKVRMVRVEVALCPQSDVI